MSFDRFKNEYICMFCVGVCVCVCFIIQGFSFFLCFLTLNQNVIFFIKIGQILILNTNIVILHIFLNFKTEQLTNIRYLNTYETFLLKLLKDDFVSTCSNSCNSSQALLHILMFVLLGCRMLISICTFV